MLNVIDWKESTLLWPFLTNVRSKSESIIWFSTFCPSLRRKKMLALDFFSQRLCIPEAYCLTWGTISVAEVWSPTNTERVVIVVWVSVLLTIRTMMTLTKGQGYKRVRNLVCFEQFSFYLRNYQYLELQIWYEGNIGQRLTRQANFSQTSRSQMRVHGNVNLRIVYTPITPNLETLMSPCCSLQVTLILTFKVHSISRSNPVI